MVMEMVMEMAKNIPDWPLLRVQFIADVVLQNCEEIAAVCKCINTMIPL